MMPGEKLITEMATFHEELPKAEAWIDGSSLQPSSKGWRIRYRGEKHTVVDGPFAETKELVAGYTIFRTKTKQEEIELTKRYPNPMGEGSDTEIEVRQLFELDDFGPSEGTERFRKMEASTKP